MYKFANKEKTVVNIPSKGIYGISPSNWQWENYQNWLAEGNITEDYNTNKEEKDEIANLKLAELYEKYDNANNSTFPFILNNVTYLFFHEKKKKNYLVQIFTIIQIMGLSNSDLIPTQNGLWKTAEFEIDEITPKYVVFTVKVFKDFCIAFFNKVLQNYGTKEVLEYEIKSKHKSDSFTPDDINNILINL